MEHLNKTEGTQTDLYSKEVWLKTVFLDVSNGLHVDFFLSYIQMVLLKLFFTTISIHMEEKLSEVGTR